MNKVVDLMLLMVIPINKVKKIVNINMVMKKSTMNPKVVMVKKVNITMRVSLENNTKEWRVALKDSRNMMESIRLSNSVLRKVVIRMIKSSFKGSPKREKVKVVILDNRNHLNNQHLNAQMMMEELKVKVKLFLMMKEKDNKKNNKINDELNFGFSILKNYILLVFFLIFFIILLRFMILLLLLYMNLNLHNE